MNQKKAKQLRRALVDDLESNETKFITKKQFYKLKIKTNRDINAFKTWRGAENFAKHRYKQMNKFVRDRLGEEWREL